MLSTIDLDALVAASRELPMLPASVTKLANLVADEGRSMEAIVEVVTYDPALTGGLLRMANSAAYNRGREVTTVQRAVMQLGAGRVLALSMGASTRDTLQQELPAYGMKAQDLWRHSVATALAAELCGRVCKAPIPAEAFTAALLHDVGKLVLCRFLDPQLVAGLQISGGIEGPAGLAAEREVLGVHHGELSGLVVQDWGLPDAIREGITHHHEPGATESVIADVIHLADVAAHRLDDPAAASGPTLEPGVAERLQLKPDGLAQLVERLGEKLDALLASYG